ncbi:esterase-like activity of phytase family protein [Allorhizobium sp. BGMRC 0089]|uniref:esterase-like activity of phytase family protein n=1 Tax=Allorhizobium sonneratiae TaxID=2934936 RepID=UPI002034365D|nr:esterase-like activity of phytase family protein [Allorhizobium sonneratiae]MCM2293770.1 esterase-like activity of phytase family protein [Allorhizobium sonneratiae]
MKNVTRLAAFLCAGVVFVNGTVAFADTTATAGSLTITNKGRVAIGRIPASQRDKFGETFGSGSGMTMDLTKWKKDGDHYTGSLWLLPDRGYNVEGTTAYDDRINRIDFTLMPVAPGAIPAKGQEQTGLKAKLAETEKLTDDKGKPFTGLDPESGIRKAANGFPDMPEARNGEISLDPEAIVRLADGSFMISDEYGPYIYHYSAQGKLISATQPPKAFLPMRKGALNFSSDNVGEGGKAPEPKNPDTGRQNNQGFEGMSLTPDGKYLMVLLQSATRQDGGDDKETRMNTRVLVYDAADVDHLKLVHEYVVPLPSFKDSKGKTVVAAQSEMLALNDTAFLMLARDSNAGQGLKKAKSTYRRIDLVDVSGATDIANTDFDGLKPVAPKGVVDPFVTVAKVSSFIDLNAEKDLARFGLHNGEPNDSNNLSEKWEAMSIAPVEDPATPDDYFLFVANDNDFLTQHGHQVGVDYKAENGAEVDTMFQVFRVTLPGMAKN